MIGSIGAENRYSTSYNNLKINRGSDKWVNSLVQTVDKDISSRADVNSAKKSTAMDSYLALSGNGIQTLKQTYSEYQSENYKFSTWQKVFDEIGGTYEKVWSKEELNQEYLNH